MNHVPVLLKETIEILNPQPGEFFIDGTLGSGGHSAEIFERISPGGILLGIDWDEKAIESMELRISTNSKVKSQKSKLILICGNYADIPDILEEIRESDPSIPLRAGGLLLDLGFSSEHLDSGKGFSFLKNEPLDMRYSLSNESRMEPNEARMTAAEVINSFTEKDLADVFWKYGEERFSRRIAKKIVEERKKKRIITTFDLVEIILSNVSRMKSNKSRIHPATKVFQSLRIYVNDELGNLEKLLKDLTNIIKDGGRTAIISYHSLEDRLVKNYFRELVKINKAEILTKKPIRPSREEIINNPRSRSAKLRVIKIL